MSMHPLTNLADPAALDVSDFVTIDVTASAPSPAPAPAPPVVLGRWQSAMALIRIWLRIAQLAFTHIPNPVKAIWALKQLERTRRQYMGNHALRKAVESQGRYFFELNTPGWPSLAFDEYHLMELDRLVPFRDKPLALKVLILAITKKCGLKCEHCFEWDKLNGKEKLSVDNLKNIVRKFQENGITQIQFSGGEPMLRVPAMLDLIESAAPGTDFWVITYGHRFTADNAKTLREAGLTGVVISLDHFIPELHNHFRGFKDAYSWVEHAAANAREAGLLISFSLCATKSFTTEANILTYMELAQRLGASFVQVLEPKAVGHYAGLDVRLTKEQLNLLDELYIKINYDATYHQLPIMVYHEYHRRKIGCTGAADRYVYVDTDGELHACPFCQNASGCASEDTLSQDLQRIRSAGCLDKVVK